MRWKDEKKEWMGYEVRKRTGSWRRKQGNKVWITLWGKKIENENSQKEKVKRKTNGEIEWNCRNFSGHGRDSGGSLRESESKKKKSKWFFFFK